MSVSGTTKSATIGYWQLTAYDNAGKRYDLTTFRGLPTTLNSFSTVDPYGAKQLQITLPGITPFDALGYGDLGWARKGGLISLKWHGKLPAGYRYGVPHFTRLEGRHGQSELSSWTPGFVWEGQIATPTIDSDTGMVALFTGAAWQLDNFQARPEYPRRPYPYEYAIARQFRASTRPHLRMKPLRVAWPADWPLVYSGPSKKTPTYLLPMGVRDGQFWTGLTTRETGKWDPVLTSYIQTLMASLYTTTGRWTLDVWANRRPVMEHRAIQLRPDASTITLDPLSPGCKLNVTVDWTQTLDVVYAQGVGLDGVAYSGQEVTSDGSHTYYLPAAARREAFPVHNNKWLDPNCMPIEIMLQVQQGLDEAHAQIVARDHLRRFSDPGVTGTAILADDPTIGGVQLPRYLVRAGMTAHIPGLFGKPEGTMVHITEANVNLDEGTNTITFDSKFRDSITVDEARMAGRDTLQVSRMLVAGQYEPPVPDQLVPWNYAKGSGFIPSGKTKSALQLFDGMPDKTQFPWTEWTTQRPPGHHKWRNCYAGPITPDGSLHTDHMWAHRGGDKRGISTWFGIPVRAAQAATIRLLQVAAYNADGTVAKVPFHISFYFNNGVGVNSMPEITTAEAAGGAEDVFGGAHAIYAAGHNYPFGSQGWEKYNADGTLTNPQTPQAHVSSAQIRIYGTYYEMAGFYPGSDPGPTDVVGTRHPNRTARLAAATGLLVDEATWSLDTTQSISDRQTEFKPYDKRSDQPKFAGHIWAMIYCDQIDASDDVYFLGRMFRTPPGAGASA